MFANKHKFGKLVLDYHWKIKSVFTLWVSLGLFVFSDILTHFGIVFLRNIGNFHKVSACETEAGSL